MTSFDEGWASLDSPWRVAFELAWEAFSAGSNPVGAVVTDAAGRIVARGRSRIGESDAPAGQLAFSDIAHAEVNALSGLPRGDHGDHVVYTTLEPCVLCTGALIHAHVGEVRFAATDPLMAGIERLPELNEWIASRWARRVGPSSGPFATWAGLLPLTWYLRQRRDGMVARAHRVADPALFALAEDVSEQGFGGGATPSLERVLRSIWPRLVAAEGGQ